MTSEYYAELVADLRRYDRVADTRTHHELANAANAIEILADQVDSKRPHADLDQKQLIDGTASITRSPWVFACRWYSESEIKAAIERNLGPWNDTGDRMPTDVQTPEFATWLTDQYRHAMRKGAELAIEETKKQIASVLHEDNNFVATYEREGWDQAKKRMERWLDQREKT